MEKVTTNKTKYNQYKAVAIILVVASVLLGVIRGLGAERADAAAMLAPVEAQHSAMARLASDALTLVKAHEVPAEAAFVEAVAAASKKLASAAALSDKAYECSALAGNIDTLCDNVMQVSDPGSVAWRLAASIQSNVESTGNVIRNSATDYNLKAAGYNKLIANQSYTMVATLTGNGMLESYPPVSYNGQANVVKNYSDYVSPYFDIGGLILTLLIAASFVAALVFLGKKLPCKQVKPFSKGSSVGKMAASTHPVIPGKTPPHRKERSK